MELSRSAQFAIRTVVDLASAGHVHTADVARRRGIPPAQGAKIIRRLARAGLVRTTRGAGGGVRLARPAEAITLREVIDAIEGPLAISRCAVYDDCPCVQPCPVRAALARVQHELERLLAGITVADLAAGSRGPARPTRAPAA
ncbi:MAG: Rrf2 family transcriptional regulator [Armatimonadota bacterium]|nr:Rrf2 family transcriptional regulator [Armatimonadota bacterium]MDR7422298.1 Rrf2 family transcriptional regulator [Armatimonadota bacterium]MDR7453750.1 Rrf2 family transcriptional regulator [Armatimonadota bacterium]MDR7456280.1 Rrf2 family transcriptional regulator [Armatimonadota bacterium]MDR7496276.1 Rrf2 family transcriptional regulator [Armatimonadota bacterium]